MLGENSLPIGWMDVDDAIRKEEPPKPTDTSSASAIALYDHWKQSNHQNIVDLLESIKMSKVYSGL